MSFLTTPSPLASSPTRIPLLLKIAYTVFMAVLIPVYWVQYGPSNFLYFCDVALLLTLVGVWRESAYLISLSAVGILIPQGLWCLDFVAQLVFGTGLGLTAYMFDADRSLFLRGLSLFHGWLPLMLVYLLYRVGYDRRAVWHWTFLAVGLCVIAYCFLPAPGADLPSAQTPRNVNYVFGLSATEPQSWMAPLVYLWTWIGCLIGLVYLPTHALLKKAFSQNENRGSI